MGRGVWICCVTVALAAAGCGGDDDSTAGTGGTSNGGTSSGGTAGTSSGGTSSGGTSSGGTAGASNGGTGGTSTGGTGTGGTGTCGTSTGGTSTGGTGTGGTSTGGTSTGGTSTGGTGGGIPTGGTLLFSEKFDNASFASRGWYDGPNGTISTTEKAQGSASSFECAFAPGATSCTNGKPARHKHTASDTVYLSFWIKFSSNWVGSGKPYHPHMFHFLTDKDSDYVGPSTTFLTTYTEVVAGKAFLALQDSKNVDKSCILKNDDTFVGCNGNFSTYSFTENRSVCACNGLVGDLDGRSCFDSGGGNWYSARDWRSTNVAFSDSAGADYKGDWHFVEAYFQMNSIQAGKGVPDGKIRWVQDGKTLISSDKILMRTGANPNLKFNQFAMLPYIGDGSPVAQSFWVDDLTVATAKP